MDRLANTALRHSFKDIWMLLIRPPRQTYDSTQLGATEFLCQGCIIKRSDIEAIHPKKNEKIVGSFYEIHKSNSNENRDTKYCIVYLHGNSGSQVNALEIVKYFLPFGISVFTFDFPGCGNSDGEYISLGRYETEYAVFMMEHIKKLKKVKNFALWGRSMGAVVALKLGLKKELNIKALVLDSPFYNLRELCWEIFREKASDVKLIFTILWKMIRKKIQSVNQFDLDDLNLLKEIENESGRPPVLFIAGTGDTFVKKHHSEKLCEKYGADPKTNLIITDGDHNSQRPITVLTRVSLFVYNSFKSKPSSLNEVPTMKDYKELNNFSRFFNNSDEMKEKLEGILKKFSRSLEVLPEIKEAVSPSANTKQKYSHFFHDIGEGNEKEMLPFNQELNQNGTYSTDSSWDTETANFKEAGKKIGKKIGLNELTALGDNGEYLIVDEEDMSLFEELCDVD